MKGSKGSESHFSDTKVVSTGQISFVEEPLNLRIKKKKTHDSPKDRERLVKVSPIMQEKKGVEIGGRLFKILPNPNKNKTTIQKLVDVNLNEFNERHYDGNTHDL